MIWQSDATGENAFRQQFAQKNFTWACRGAPPAPWTFIRFGAGTCVLLAPWRLPLDHCRADSSESSQSFNIDAQATGTYSLQHCVSKIQKFSFSFSWTICCFIAELYAEVFSMTLISRLPSPTPRTEPAPPHFLLALGKVLPTRSHTLPPHTLPSPHSPLLRRCPPCYAHGT